MENQNDNYGRGPQSEQARTYKMFVHVRAVDEYGDLGRIIDRKHVEFKSHNTELPDLDEEYNIMHGTKEVGFEVMTVQLS